MTRAAALDSCSRAAARPSRPAAPPHRELQLPARRPDRGTRGDESGSGPGGGHRRIPRSPDVGLSLHRADSLGQRRTRVGADQLGSAISPAATVQLVPPDRAARHQSSPVSISTDGRLIATSSTLQWPIPRSATSRVRNPSGSSYTGPAPSRSRRGEPAPPSGLDLTLSACNQPGTWKRTTRRSTVGPVPRLAVREFPGAFQTLSGFITLDAVLDVRTAGSSILEFWRSEDAGATPPASRCPTASPESPCPSASNDAVGRGLAAADACITAYAPGLGGANHAVSCSPSRGTAIAPTTLDGGQNYYGFRLDAGGSPAAARVHDAGGDRVELGDALPRTRRASLGDDLTGPGRRSNIVTVNGGPAGARRRALDRADVARVSPMGWSRPSIYGRNFESGATARLVHLTETITGQERSSRRTDARWRPSSICSASRSA